MHLVPRFSKVEGYASHRVVSPTTPSILQSRDDLVPQLYDRLKQEGLAVASIVRDDTSTLHGNDPFPRARNARSIGIRI